MPDPFSLRDSDAWSAAVQGANPAAILVALRLRMGPALLVLVTEDDIWQETLLRAWRTRDTFAWQGMPAFRRWLLAIADHVISDHRDHFLAQKRAVGRTMPLADADDPMAAEPWSSTSPSRLASERERARLMAEALATLDDEVREVVRLRLFDELSIEEIATRLQLGISGVRHRFRKGAEAYARRLRVLDSTSGHGSSPPDPNFGG
jgi:RNA polymerase sigma factor (sigma-70 family)